MKNQTLHTLEQARTKEIVQKFFKQTDRNFITRECRNNLLNVAKGSNVKRKVFKEAAMQYFLENQVLLWMFETNLPKQIFPYDKDWFEEETNWRVRYALSATQHTEENIQCLISVLTEAYNETKMMYSAWFMVDWAVYTKEIREAFADSLWFCQVNFFRGESRSVIGKWLAEDLSSYFNVEMLHQLNEEKPLEKRMLDALEWFQERLNYRDRGVANEPLVDSILNMFSEVCELAKKRI